MACYNPLLAVDFGPVGDSEKHRLHFLNPYEYDFKRAREKYGRFLMFLPCNKCVGCAQDYARSWQCRIMCEYESRKERQEERSCFLTLTYNNSNCPRDPSPEHLRQFIKAVRNKYGNGISFFGCGEKGSRTRRSHYHLILFGVDFEDKVPVAKRGLFYCYESKIANKLWDKGFVLLGSLDIKSAGYVSKYCDKKKISGVSDGEFVIMSRGLGKQYFKDHYKEIFESDYLYFEGNKFKMPRMFIRWALNHDDFLTKMDAQFYVDRKREVAQSFRYDKCKSFETEEAALLDTRDILLYKKSKEEVLRDVY